MRRISFTLLASLALAFLQCISTVFAETPAQTRSKVNRNVVGIMAGSASGTDMALANDLGIAFSDGYDMRVVSMVGLGSVKDVEDLLYLRGVDMAIVQQDVIDFMVVNEIYPSIRKSVRLIAPLSVDQFHVLASNRINTIGDLKGQKVNYGPTDGGTFMTSSVVFDALQLDVEVTTYPHKIALQKLREGEIAAMTRASGKPVSIIEAVKDGEPFHLLPVPVEPLLGTYGPATLDSRDYPALIEDGKSVQTVAVANALIGYDWPKGHSRGRALTVFIDRFFSSYAKLLDDAYHESWKSIDISAEIPGLPRYWAAEEALRRMNQ